jgi:hypothetical protein
MLISDPLPTAGAFPALVRVEEHIIENPRDEAHYNKL